MQLQRRLSRGGLFAARPQEDSQDLLQQGGGAVLAADAKREVDHGALRAPTKRTLREAATAWLDGAEAGRVRNRSGDRYKPSTLRGYRQALEERILPLIGGEKLSAITTYDLQRWSIAGTPRTTRPPPCATRSSRCRRSTAAPRSRGACRSTRPRTSSCRRRGPARSRSSLPRSRRSCSRRCRSPIRRCGGRPSTPAFATASSARCAGARSTSSPAPSRVRESWDPKAGSIDPKTRTSMRSVPMPDRLRELLLDRRLEAPNAPGSALAFGRDETEPFHAATLYRRADSAWRRRALRSACACTRRGTPTPRS